MRVQRTFTVLPVAIVTVAMSLAAACADTVGNDHHYSNQTPYGNPASTVIVEPPDGYELFFLENVGRHGARSLTNDGAERRALAVWRTASRAGALTTRGKKLAREIKTFQRAENKIGYGNLSTVGKAEWVGIGRRTADNYRSFWSGLSARGETIAMQTSPVYRTKQSANRLRAGLKKTFPQLAFEPREVDDDLLITEGSSKAGRKAIAKVLKRKGVRAAARQVLRRVYTKSYVRSLDDPVGKALDIYLLYTTAPGMARDTRRTFAAYVPLSAARRLSEAVDARHFYRFGPGVKGERRSYKKARPVLDDFFDDLDARIAGDKTAAVFRLAHGEVTMPFAALIKAPGSQQQASKNRAYSHASNPWRGYVAGRLAGNIEWAGYRNADGQVLVTMRYNEQPVQFRSSCTPSSANKYFYRVSQLKSCLR